MDYIKSKHLVGGRVRDTNKFNKHKHCIDNDTEYVCFGDELISSHSHPNKIYIIIDFLPTDSKTKTTNYKQQLLNILFNFNVDIKNIVVISNTPLTKSINKLYPNNLILSIKDTKKTYISKINQYIASFIQENITAKNISNCSVILDILAKGTLKLEQNQKLISFNGKMNNADFLNAQEIFFMLDPLYKSANVRDVTFILNSCFASFKFGGIFFDWMVNNNQINPNTNIFTSKPFIIYMYILILFLETNPKTNKSLYNSETMDYIKLNLLNIGLGDYIIYINNFREYCEPNLQLLETLINRQKTIPFKGDRYESGILSNELLNLFIETANTSSHILSHHNIDTPFKHLDLLNDLKLDLITFNQKLIKYYLEIIKSFDPLSEPSPETELLNIHFLNIFKSTEEYEFIIFLIDKSLKDIQFPFLNSINKKGMRYKQKNAITLDDLF